METRETFLKACNEICGNIGSFEAFRKGQVLRRQSSDSDLYREISFQSSSLNSASSIVIIPHIAVFSKKLKKYLLKEFPGIGSSGVIYANHIGYISPLQSFKEWHLAGASYSISVEQISKLIKTHVFPVFDIFDSTERAVDFLKSNGTSFNQWTIKSLMPLDFMLYSGQKSDAEAFFANYINSSKRRNKLCQFYLSLKECDAIDPNYSEFEEAGYIKRAFMKNINLSLP
ncbi:MAG TPA: hypothetical protein PKK43_06485 [Spirochaetota bacterium]|nr:hypothetical protein [Spirochaetota bacterium]